jgi:hypothetical protein
MFLQDHVYATNMLLVNFGRLGNTVVLSLFNP